MLSSVEGSIKTENELPLNLKTQESPNFPSTTPPSSPNLSQVPEHILLAVNSMNNPTANNNGQTTSLHSSIANSLANSIANCMAGVHHQASPSPKIYPTSPMSNTSMANNLSPVMSTSQINRMSPPVMNSYGNVIAATTSSNMTSTGYLDHNGQPPSMVSSNGGFSRKSPPNLQQTFNHLPNHVTSLPSSIGRLTLGLGGHYTPSPIQEHHDEMHSPVSSGGGMSPPLSPPQAASPPPTMVPPSGSDRISSVGHRSSPSSSGNGGLSNLHHALHGLHNLHNLHNLHSLQNLQTQMAALASLQGLGNSNPSSISSLLHQHLAQHPDALNGSGNGANNSTSPHTPSSQSGNVPQMVLTAGSVPQSVQGAQLLIPTSQGIAVQPILTIPLGQAGPMSNSSLVNSLSSFPPFQNQSPHHQPHHQHQSSHAGSSGSSPLPTSSTSSSNSPHPLLGLAGLPPSLFHPHSGHNNNNNSTNTNNNNIIPSEKPKLPLPMSSPAQDAISGLGARLGASHYAPHHMQPPTRYSPDFLDTHNQPTINQTTGNVVDGVNLDEIKEFAKAFKIRRLSLGLTQTQVGQALSITEGPAYSQSAICRFEKLDITPKSAQKIKPVLERWMQEAEDRYKNGQHTLTDYMGNEPSKKRKRRTSFTPQALEVLNAHFERNTHPSGAEITALAEQLGYEREVVRIWFCNKRQALKNTVRMMAKPHQPPPPPPSSHQMN